MVNNKEYYYINFFIVDIGVQFSVDFVDFGVDFVDFLSTFYWKYLFCSL